ncbi:D-alanyl-D-alanine carboxypeptidase [Candidatus Parcubacteria bacterium]|nr:D-alanyl-D-alanine carboxypeptidase [Candidatus Parcubacteria bacterium]
MKFKFYLSLVSSVAVGIFVAIGVLSVGSFVVDYIKTQSYAIYDSASDLGSGKEYEIEEKKVEELSKTDEGVPVRDKYFLYEESQDFPKLTSQAYLVADLDNGQIIKQRNRDEIYSIASLTKLLTALVSLETLDQNDQTTVSYNAVNTYGKQGGLYSGQKIMIFDLLYPLLLESSNDAGEALAEHGKRSVFMENMNGKAKSIGLFDSYFDDPSGLSQYNVSTADDLFKLLRYIYKKQRDILEITKLREYENVENKWFNNSRFRSDGRYYGGKNGYTDEALYTLVSVFDLPLVDGAKYLESNDRRIAIILLKGTDTEGDTREIISWLLDNIYYQ